MYIDSTAIFLQFQSNYKKIITLCQTTNQHKYVDQLHLWLWLAGIKMKNLLTATNCIVILYNLIFTCFNQSAL